MSELGSEVRRMTRLATPVALTQLGTMIMGMVDILMVGHLGVEPLSSVSLGRVWVMGTLLLGLGVMLGLDPIVAQAHGARDRRRLGIALQQSVPLALLTSIPIAVAWAFTAPALILFGQDPELSRAAQDYVAVQIPGVPAFLLFTGLRQYLQGRGIVRPALWVVLIAIVFNLALNWILIYGNWGAPALGIVGAGLATTFTRYLMLLLLVGVTLLYRLHRAAWVPWSRESFRLSGLGEILRYGLPVSAHIGLELWAFEIATLLSGRLGAVELAAHTVVLNLASVAFMIPLGISQAAVTRVGNLIGEGKRGRAQLAAWVSLGMGVAAMLLSGTLFVVFRHGLPRLYSDDPGLIAAAAVILPIAGLFQIFDGTQVIGTGILRGMGRTRPAAAINFVGYYLLALPIGAGLAFGLGWGLPGIWWGLLIGLGAVAGLLVLYIRRRGPARVAVYASRAGGRAPSSR
jgi:MATE family multidrug resistance protein